MGSHTVRSRLVVEQHHPRRTTASFGLKHQWPQILYQKSDPRAKVCSAASTWGNTRRRYYLYDIRRFISGSTLRIAHATVPDTHRPKCIHSKWRRFRGLTACDRSKHARVNDTLKRNVLYDSALNSWSPRFPGWKRQTSAHILLTRLRNRIIRADSINSPRIHHCRRAPTNLFSQISSFLL